MVRRPSVQPWVRCCGEQFHPPQQLLVWSRFVDAARYGSAQAGVAPPTPPLAFLRSPSSRFPPFQLTSSPIFIPRQSHKTVTCREPRSSVLRDKAGLLSPSCRFQRRVVGATRLSKIVSRGWKTLPRSLPGNRLVGPAQDFSDVGMKRVRRETCLTNTSCHPCSSWLAWCCGVELLQAVHTSAATCPTDRESPLIGAGLVCCFILNPVKRIEAISP